MVQVDETGKTTFRFRHRTAGPVFLVGDFCAWQTDHLPMRRVGFRYVAAGQWFTDYAAFGVHRNDLGDFNSVVRVPKVKAARTPRFRFHRVSPLLARSA